MAYGFVIFFYKKKRHIKVDCLKWKKNNQNCNHDYHSNWKKDNNEKNAKINGVEDNSEESKYILIAFSNLDFKNN